MGHCCHCTSDFLIQSQETLLPLWTCYNMYHHANVLLSLLNTPDQIKLLQSHIRVKPSNNCSVNMVWVRGPIYFQYIPTAAILVTWRHQGIESSVIWTKHRDCLLNICDVEFCARKNQRAPLWNTHFITEIKSQSLWWSSQKQNTDYAPVPCTTKQDVRLAR